MVDMHDMLVSLRRRQPVLDSRDAEESMSRLGGVCDRFVVERCKPGDFFLTIRSVRLPGSAIVDIHSGAPIRLHSQGSRGQYRILLPLRRGCEMTIGRNDVGCEPRRAAIVSPDHAHAVFSEHGSERLWLTIGEDIVTRMAGALLGEGIDRPVVFAPAIDLRRREGDDLLSAVSFAARHLGDQVSLFSSPWLRAELEQMIATALLLGQPNSHSARLEQPARGVPPRYMTRAIDFIHGNLQRPMSLSDIVAATGVPGRTLRQHFQHTHGLSPMAYLRKARFEKARELLSNEPDMTVSEAALRTGFDHLGRFAVGYRRRFGEKPSRTLARRNGRIG